jgi:flagellar basal body P-ring formation protein FlgA
VILMGLATGVWGAETLEVVSEPMKPLLSVRFEDRVEVEEDQILLGRIARIDGDDPQQVRRLESVVLGRSPLPGKSRTLDGPTIRMRLKQSGHDPEQIDLQVPAEVEVSRAAVTVGSEQIAGIVRDFIRQQTAGESEGLQIKEIRSAEPVVLPKGRMTTRVIPPRNSELAGMVPLSVVFTVGEDFERRVTVTAILERSVKVVVTRRPLGRFKPIEEEDIEIKASDLAGLPADRITDVEAVIGKRTRRALDSGTVLRPDLVELPPLVKHGDRVRIVAETAGLTISAVGQVKQKGVRGELIPVVNLDSNKVIHARVVDAHTVRIEF